MGHSLLTLEFYSSTNEPKWSLECIFLPGQHLGVTFVILKGVHFLFPTKKRPTENRR